MMRSMFDVVPSVVVPALVSVVGSVASVWVTGRYISPSLEARNRRKQAGHQVRDKVSQSLITIMSASGQLQNTEPPEAATDTVRAALENERDRWRQQLDDATRYLVDNVAHFALTYPDTRLMALATRYIASARMLMISDRTEAEKLRHLRELTEPFFLMYFAHRRRPLKFVEANQLLEERLDALEAAGEEDAALPTS